jgi:hypothetical protein
LCCEGRMRIMGASRLAALRGLRINDSLGQRNVLLSIYALYTAKRLRYEYRAMEEIESTAVEITISHFCSPPHWHFGRPNPTIFCSKGMLGISAPTSLHRLDSIVNCPPHTPADTQRLHPPFRSYPFRSNVRRRWVSSRGL